MNEEKDSKPSGESQGLVVVALAVENVKRIRALSIQPPSIGIVEIAGRNGQGKSSAIDSMTYALGGGDVAPEMPIRRGQTSAKVVCVLRAPGQIIVRPQADFVLLPGDIVVTRTWTLKGSYLSVERVGPSGERLRMTKPQEFLDGIVGLGLGFDPTEFMRLSPKAQGEMLLKLLALPEDPRTLDAQRDQIAGERLMVNREVARLTAVLASTPDVEAPETEVSIAALVAEMERLGREAGEQRTVRQVRMTVAQDLAALRGDVARLDGVIRDLELRLSRERAERDRVAVLMSDAAEMMAGAEERVAALPDLAPAVARVQEQLAGAEATNVAVRQRVARRKLVSDLRAVNTQSDEFTRRIEALDAHKRELIASAPFPIPGLGFEIVAGAYVVTYEGVPLSQASSSLRMRVGLAIAMALAPRVRVMLLREGSLLDEEARAEVERVAAERGWQVWLETVGGGKEGAFVIEDGGVLRPAAEEVAP